jgi:hypothetical protein
VFNDQDKLQYYYTYLNFEPDIKIWFTLRIG